ncbi:response regulator [Paenibacillus vini]|uniref:LytR/AlgR family response regulator transcription factor n=1 Tax=Paenibacillus vini TaxID=1476024 RepID=UPI0025B69AE3|nr:response regulator [Paenibacillus vini]MDN4067627.1 response regulator [Paenibacillus vini]
MLVPLTAIVVGDENQDRDILEQYARHMGLIILSTVASEKWLIEDCLRYEPDIVFLDINFNANNLDAYEKVLQHGLKPHLILISTMEDSSLILAGLKLNCIDFVIKPFSYTRLLEAVEKVRRSIEKDLLISKALPARIIQVKSNYRTVFINENNLIYAHKLKNTHKTFLYVDGERESGIETSLSLAQIQSQCSQIIFMPNQSNLVNIQYIRRVFASENNLGTYIIKLDNDVEIDLSRRKRKSLEQLFLLTRFNDTNS